MAYYNNFYPNYAYGPNYQQNYQYQQTQTIQNGGFVPVQSEEEGRAYPIKHGTSIKFYDESKPYVYTKTLGYSLLDTPIFEKYRLVKEDSQDGQKEVKEEETENLPIYITKSEFEPFREELEALKERIGQLRKELGDE